MMQKPTNDTPATATAPKETDKRKDPATHEPVSHPVGVATTVTKSTMSGPPCGTVAPTDAGKPAAKTVNPATEEKYWRDNHAASSYADAANGYDQFAPAYKYGWESAGRSSSPGQTFESAESDLGRGWDKAKGASRLAWDKARDATREAWNRVHSA